MRPCRWLALLLIIASAACVAPPASAADPVKLDVLFVGAHPDDEAFAIPSFGQWAEYDGIESGVLTITRGEGGGNAVGPEEGVALGLLREDEERRAVGHGEVDDVFYLDDVDFYYTVSAPLTEKLWGHQQSLARVVRIVRQTRPEVILTMNPSPAPGNHGNHQYAARLAVEAFHAAADPRAFPEQLAREDLRTWAAKKVVREGLAVVGPDAVTGTTVAGTPLSAVATSENECARAAGSHPTDVVYNVWRGRMSQRKGLPWALVGAQAANEYASQGFSGPIAVVFGALFLGFCDQYAQIASRVPGTMPPRGQSAIFEGATFPAAGGLPEKTIFHLTTGRFAVVPGVPFRVRAHARSGDGSLGEGAVELTVPAGWSVRGSGTLGIVDGRRTRRVTFEVTPPAEAQPGRVRLGGRLSTDGGTGRSLTVVEVVPAVRTALPSLPHVAEFRAWAERFAPQLGDLVKDRLAIGVGETRPVAVTLTNAGVREESGQVSLTPPDGFSVHPATIAYDGLRPGRSQRVDFTITNTDADLATSDSGGSDGDYDFRVTTTSSTGSATETGALNLVPVTRVPPAAAAPAVDGAESAGEYAGEPLDVSRQWEGLAPPLTPADASATAKVTRTADALYFVVHVTDQLRGAVLPPSDCKRHWRTDSVEITIDPRGNSENTSTTFKAGIFPSTEDPANGNPPCYQRDADNHQGPGPETAPGMRVASTVTSPYRGYTIEARVPFADLPAAVDPARMGLNVLVYDSDTQDKTGQHRLGWSTWGGVQGDPYRWGHAVLAGHAPLPGQPTTAPPPTVPDTAAQSVASPRSILQSVRNDVALGGHPAAKRAATARLRSARLDGDELRVLVEATAAGTAHLFGWTGERAAASSDVTFKRGGTRAITWRLDAADRDAVAERGAVLLGFVNRRGAVAADSFAVTRPGDD